MIRRLFWLLDGLLLLGGIVHLSSVLQDAPMTTAVTEACP